MLEQIRIYGKGNNSHDTCNVLISFECVEPSYQEQLDGNPAYCVLHRVQLEPIAGVDYKIDVSLNDSDVREHFEDLLSANWHGYRVETGVAA